MLRFKSLNDSSSESEDEDGKDCSVPLTKEAQEEQLHTVYQESLMLLRDGKKNEATTLLLSLLDSLNNLPDNINIMSTDQLKFLAFKNLGMIEENDINYFMDALEIDPSDAGLWIKTGCRAFDVLQDYRVARNCFEAAKLLSPDNWIILDRLLESYFVLHDLFNVVVLAVECLQRDSSMRKAKILLYESCRLTPPWAEQVPENMKSYLTLLPHDMEYYDAIMEKFRLLKSKRKERIREYEMASIPKRAKFHLSLDITEDSLNIIGNRLLRLYDQTQKDVISPINPLEVVYEKGSSLSNREETSTASAEESSSQENQKDNQSSLHSKERRKSNRGNSNPNFPIEFMEKRRSGRVQRLTKTNGNEQSVLETLVEMIPNPIKERILEDDAVEEDGSEEHLSLKPKEVNQKSIQDTEKEVVASFINQIKSLLDTKQYVTLLDAIHVYLSEVTKKCHYLNISRTFTKLYGIYRKNHILPPDLSTKIDKDISLEDLFITLVANEINYQMSEEFFLTRMSNQLELFLPDEEVTSFCIRLLFLRGTQGNEPELLDVIIDMLQQKPLRIEASNGQVISIALVKSIVGTKCGSDLELLMAEEKYQEIISSLYPKPEEDISPSEEAMLVKSLIECEEWDKGILWLSKRDNLSDAGLRLLIKCVTSKEGGIVNYKIAYNLCKLAVDKCTTRSWSCLYWIFFRDLDHKNKKEDNQMISFIRVAHDFLGKKKMCTSSNGEFLLLCLDYMLNHSLGSHKALDDYCIDCFVCLFGFPPKKSPSHGGSAPTRVKMSWDHSSLLFSYFTPDELPDYDSNKTDSIPSETEGLLLDLLELVPENLKPDNQSKFIIRFLTDGEELPEYERPPSHPVTQNLYYLLADYYFKNKDFRKAKYYYILDLAINTDRFDSWAGIALTRTHQLDHDYLSKGDNFTKRETEKFYKICQAAFRCYKKGLALNAEDSNLWIEYGNLAYNVSSQMSRIRRSLHYQNSRLAGRPQQPENQGFDNQQLKDRQKECLALAKEAFETASKLDLEEEQWLPYYVLGKISEKSHIIKALEFYELADLNLYLGNATYPKRVAFYSAPNLAIEAVEVHYRIHAAVLKFLTQKPNATRGILLRIKTHLVKAGKSAFVSEVESFRMDPDERIRKEANETIRDLVDMTSDRLNRSTETIRQQVFDLCIGGIQRCLSRFPEHYKSKYRLAFVYYTKAELNKAKMVLFDQIPDVKIYKTTTNISGLFSDRKPNNFFNGIWMIPVEEVERPGTFSSHMFRSAYLAIRVATTLFDYATLCSMSIQLSRIPEAGKKYLREGDRLLLSKEAYDSCVAILKNHLVLAMQTQPPSAQQTVVQEITSVCEKFVRSNVFVQEANQLHTECVLFYRTFRSTQIPAAHTHYR